MLIVFGQYIFILDKSLSGFKYWGKGGERKYNYSDPTYCKY